MQAFLSARNFVVKIWEKNFLILIMLLVLLSVLDALFTTYYLKLGATEANPILNWSLKTGGLMGLWSLKMGLTFMSSSILYQLKSNKYSIYILLMGLLIYIPLIVFHLYHLI